VLLVDHLVTQWGVQPGTLDLGCGRLNEWGRLEVAILWSSTRPMYAFSDDCTSFERHPKAWLNDYPKGWLDDRCLLTTAVNGLDGQA